MFTIDYIIKKVIDYSEEKGKYRFIKFIGNELVKEIAKWKLRSTENVLKALLKNNMDDIAE